MITIQKNTVSKYGQAVEKVSTAYFMLILFKTTPR
jgi:hypothetical protein